jgi:transposase InsO family protein
VVACDFLVVITATFRTLYVFVVMQIGSRRILHYSVTAHPTAECTLQQFREALLGDPPYRFVIHDRDRILAAEVDQRLANLGVRVLSTPVRAPQANSTCERLGGSLRRECLDWLIPFHQRHLQMILPEWTGHYNRGRPHSALGPGLPETSSDQVPANEHRHRLPVGYRVVKRTVLGGLHHEYGLAKEAA